MATGVNFKMEDETNANDSKLGEQVPSSGKTTFTDHPDLPRVTNLRQATSHLKIEALRRYRQRHSFDIEDYDDRGSREKTGDFPSSNIGDVAAGVGTTGTGLNPVIEKDGERNAFLLAAEQAQVGDVSSGSQVPRPFRPPLFSEITDDDLVTWGESSNSLSDSFFSLNQGLDEDLLYLGDPVHSDVVVCLDGDRLEFDSPRSLSTTADSHYVAPLKYPTPMYKSESPTPSETDDRLVTPKRYNRAMRGDVDESSGPSAIPSIVTVTAPEGTEKVAETMESPPENETAPVGETGQADSSQDIDTSAPAADVLPPEVPSSGKTTFNDHPDLPRVINLRQTTSHLKIEALRRYRQRHSFDIEDYDDCGSREKTEDFPSSNIGDVAARVGTTGTGLNPVIEKDGERDAFLSAAEQAQIGDVSSGSQISEITDDDLVTWGESSDSLSNSFSSLNQGQAETEVSPADGDNTETKQVFDEGANSSRPASGLVHTATETDPPTENEGEIENTDEQVKHTEEPSEGQPESQEPTQSQDATQDEPQSQKTDTLSQDAPVAGEQEEKSEASEVVVADGERPAESQEGEKPTEAQEGAVESGKTNQETGAETGGEVDEDIPQTDGAVESAEGDTDQGVTDRSEVTPPEDVNVWGESKEDLQDTMAADFFYNNDDHISVATVQEESGLPLDMLTLDHSYGYDCTKRANLHILDDKTVCFVAGNLVELLNLVTKEQTYLRSTSGGGIGAIAVHPSRKFFAVAEKGKAPNINIYEYPSLKLYRILRGGTEQYFTYVDFSPDGELLASQGGDPDFMLTVWRWNQEKIVLRSKAFSQEVFRVTFSTELEGQLTTAGTSHIRFWKMADTFTGLKLQGQLGKFGRTEISDIEGYVELPDGKVLSGCEWGNLLVWDGGLIKVEISRKHKKPCHDGPIQQILLDEGELMTVGIDGYVRVWDFETIDTAEGADEVGLFEMEPMNELQVDTDVQLKCIVKSVDTENEPTIWYAQDANGGIWKLDLSFSHTSLSPEKLMTYHAGPIWAADSSPVSHLVATTGADHTVRVFDYVSRKQLSESKFSSAGTSLLWCPDIIDPKGSTVLVGFSDGVVRVLNVSQLADHKGRDECDILLGQAFKPHTQPVTCLSVDNKGETLASGSADGTIFFMSIGKTYEPIGFIKMPTGVRSLQWSPQKFKKQTILVFCDEGHAVELDAPEPGKFDTAHTYQMSGLAMKTFQFKSIKSHLRHEEELAQKAKEEEERKKREEEERKKRIERGIETESEQGDEEEGKKMSREPSWQAYIPTDPSPILCGFYSEEGKFWLSMGGFDAGYLYECKFLTEEEKANILPEKVDEPLRAISVLESDDVPISEMKFSGNNRQVLMGMENGAVRIQQMDAESEFDEHDLSMIGPYWMLSIHDNQYGNITRLMTSFDNSYIVTVGADGNFFSFTVMDQDKLEEKVAAAKARIPSAKIQDKEKVVDDIDDPNAYSIEDAKQKAEHDKMMRLAEEKKKEVRRHIAKLRRDFKTLLESNETLPNHIQLQRDEFEMDPEIKEELQKQTRDKIEQVHKEMAWDSEKHRVALEKLRKKFKDVVECERIVVKAFNTPHEVASFRASRLSQDFYQMKANFERRKTTFVSGQSRDHTRDMRTGQSEPSDNVRTPTDLQEQADTKVKTSLKGSMGERITKSLQKVEEKKRRRAARKAQWDELFDSKPDDDYEDPADVSNIKEAKENMGDYKLKTAPDYVVPDHMRMNVEKARGRLLVLKEQIHQYKYDYNTKLLSMRDKKICIIEEIYDLVSQLHNVQAELGPEESKPVPHIPEMHPEEMPERRLEYTRESLLVFKKELEAKELAAKKGGASQTGFGGFGGGGAKSKGSSPTPTPKHGSSLSGLGKSASDSLSLETQYTMTVDKEDLSPLERQLKEANEIKLLYERDRLLKRIDDMKQHFDADLRLLRHDKFHLDIIMKNADLRHVTLFEELVLLKEFEKSEDVLAFKVENKEHEKLEMQTKVIECQAKLENKRKDIEKLQEREKALLGTFVASMGDNNKFAEYLTKVFKKKIKRAKKKAVDADGSDEESDDDSDDESDWDESDEESESEAGGYDLDICPSGCDQNIYDNTCQLREKKLDIEELLAEEKKANEALKKELESLQKKSKIIDSGLKTAENDLEAFQLEKQQKINELDVVVTLKLHQIQYMLNGALPQDLSYTLVFESNGVIRLQYRIKELEHEKSLQKKQMKESRRKHVQLIKDRKHMESRISEMDEECNQMMIGKFGCIVDLEKLETITVNRNIEELKEKLRTTEIQNSEDLIQWDERISQGKDHITDLIRENTNKLDQLCVLKEEKKSLEKSLDSRQKRVGGEYSGVRKSDLRERQRLIQLVQLQAQEVDALKEEITLLSRKGGHILPPAQPPMPQATSNVM